MEDKCPFCGAQEIERSSTMPGHELIGFACGNAYWNDGKRKNIYKSPSSACYETQIAALQAGLREAIEVVKKSIANMGLSNQYSELWYDLHEQAAVLLPKLEDLVKEGQ